jgi:uncharacterized protein YkwD
VKHVLTQRLGAFGMTAALTLFGAAGLLQCAPAPAPSTSTASASLSVNSQVVALVNQQRAARGLAPLAISGALTSAAEGHSRDQAQRSTMSHTGSNGSNVYQRITAAGYWPSAWGENVAAGQPTANDVMNAWMASSGHRANILSANFTEIGVAAVASANGTLYWTMDLGRPA